MTDNVSNHRPEYDDRLPEWQLMRDAARGETAVKGAGETYLPMPSGFTTMQDGGVVAYAKYKFRAQFPDIVDPTIGGMSGLIHRVESQVVMPEAMAFLFENADGLGTPLEALQVKITTELLETGRYCLLVAAPAEGGDPYLAGYTAEALINWDDDGTFYVLDESGQVREGFNWVDKQKFRVLEIAEGRYQQRVFEGDNANEGEPVIPSAVGGKTLSEIPFVVINARGLGTETEAPPLLGVARSAVAMYQLSADYRWQLFMTGQETLFILGGDAPANGLVGAGVIVPLKGEPGGPIPDAKYVGPDGTGIDAHRQAIQDEKQNAAQSGARLFDETAPANESGDAKRMRYTAQTATLVTIAQASAKGLEKALKYVAEMLGLNPDEVSVTANLAFIETKMNPADAEALVRIWQTGGISYDTLYELLQKGELASMERTAEEERELIDAEQTGGDDTLPPIVAPKPGEVPPSDEQTDDD
jgi:hypothetical protein